MNDIDPAAGSGGPSARDDDTRDALPNVQKPSPATTSGGSEVLTSLSRRPKRNQVRLPDATTADYHHATPEQLLAGARRLVGKHFDEAALVEALRKSSDSPQARFQAFRDAVLDRALVLPTGAMKIVGHGGDHAVYTNIEGAPQNVVKISRFSISRFVTGGLLFGRKHLTTTVVDDGEKRHQSGAHHFRFDGHHRDRARRQAG
ncbi:hypothetical protein [Trinickia acidisoli]|uniref:hypothetical protein n=1 Tax=Trinickia acidisoli TaxID=2767482 RepID=UPI001A8F0C1C|nr:hypothetical protein [Trinickia acidisoli]